MYETPTASLMIVGFNFLKTEGNLQWNITANFIFAQLRQPNSALTRWKTYRQRQETTIFDWKLWFDSKSDYELRFVIINTDNRLTNSSDIYFLSVLFYSYAELISEILLKTKCVWGRAGGCLIPEELVKFMRTTAKSLEHFLNAWKNWIFLFLI